MDKTELLSVLEELGLPSGPAANPEPRTVPKHRILELMKSDNPEVEGAVYSFIMNAGRARHIAPPLGFSDYQEFVLRYYFRCLKQDPKGVWVDSRYSAGWDLVNWSSEIWRDKARRSALASVKALLARLYKEGDPELRVCIETAILEHLFEQKPIRRFFEDWKKEPVLATAFKNATAWVRGGGDSPLGKPPKGGNRN